MQAHNYMVRANPCKQTLMHEPAKASEIQLRAVRLWLLAAAAMIFLTLIVGGATRLTESGLSIVEWKPITGVLPPLSEDEWRTEFGKYQTIPQYRELNRGMSLEAFKTIYWWEWSHRLLARLTGAVFLLPFLVFPGARHNSTELARPVVDAFLSRVRRSVRSAGGWCPPGSTQGVSVSQYRLAFHLTLATRDLWGDRLDRAATGAVGVNRGAGAPALCCIGDRVSAAVSDLSWRVGCRTRCGSRLQHVADDRWVLHSVVGTAVVH